jgi:hypothetical protein
LDTSIMAIQGKHINLISHPGNKLRQHAFAFGHKPLCILC